MFTVMDHDLFLANDFAGEVHLSLNNIPGITGDEVSGFSALNPLSLPLTHPKKGNTSMYIKIKLVRDKVVGLIQANQPVINP